MPVEAETARTPGNKAFKQCCGKRLLSIRSQEDGIKAETVENTELKPLMADLGVLANTKVF